MAVREPTQRVLLQGFILSFAATGLVGIYCLVAGSTIGGITGSVLGSTTIVGAAAILGLAGAVVWERRKWHQRIMRVSVVST